MEEEKAGAGAADKEKKRTKKEILDLLGGDNTPSFLLPGKRVFVYRSKTGK